MKFKYLNTKNPDYNELRIKKLELLYCGGDELLDNAKLFIPKESMENALAYSSRLKCASYRNHLAQIINDYVANLFSKALSVVPASDADDATTPGDNIEGEGGEFYREFAADTDLKGNPLSNVLRDLLTESLTSGRAYLGVDFPKPDQLPESLPEEEAMGLSRAYTYCIPTLSMLDWQYDDFGKYTFIVLRNDIIQRKSLQDQRDMKTIQFKVWNKENDDSVSFEVYEIQCKVGKEPKGDEECTLTDSGKVSFKDIPVLCLDVPEQLWIGGLIGNLVVEHFKRYSALVFAENRSLFSLPVYKQGPELPANGDLNELQSNPGRGNQVANTMRLNGFAVIGGGDDITFEEPEGKCYELVDKQLSELVDAFHQITAQMANTVSANTSQAGRSGTSKKMDHHSKEIVLSAYGALVKEFAVKLYNLVSKARVEDINWQALGMDNYKIIDRAMLLQEATTMNLIAIPSKTWKKKHLVRIAFDLTDDLTPEEQLTIKDEIDKNLEGMSDDIIYGMAAETPPKPNKPVPGDS